MTTEKHTAWKHIQIGGCGIPLAHGLLGVLLFTYILIILFTFQDYGITSDEPNLMLGLVEEPPLSGRLIWKIGISIGLAMGIRVGGLVLLAYLGLFLAILYIQIGTGGPIWEASTTNRIGSIRPGPFTWMC